MPSRGSALLMGSGPATFDVGIPDFRNGMPNSPGGQAQVSRLFPKIPGGYPRNGAVAAPTSEPDGSVAGLLSRNLVYPTCHLVFHPLRFWLRATTAEAALAKVIAEAA
jgi:hypothetical protein